MIIISQEASVTIRLMPFRMPQLVTHHSTQITHRMPKAESSLCGWKSKFHVSGAVISCQAKNAPTSSSLLTAVAPCLETHGTRSDFVYISTGSPRS